MRATDVSRSGAPKLQIMLVASPRNHSFFPINIDRNTPAAGPYVYYVCIGFSCRAWHMREAQVLGRPSS